MLKKLGMLGALLVLVFSLVACSSGATKPEDSSKPSGGKKNGKLVIGFSMDTLEEERWQKDRDLFVEKAESLGATVNVQAANGDDAKQISQAENLISQGVDVLVVVPHNAEVAASIVEMAHKEGIKVISYDRLIKNSDVDLYVSFDNERVGEMQAKAITELKPKGNYVLIEGADTDNNAHLFKQGQMNVLQPLIDKGDIKVVYDQWTDEWDPANALTNMENALTANKNKVDAVVAANDGTAGGVIQALAAQKLDGKVPVSGQDAELAAVRRLVDGTQTMTVYKPIKLIAETVADAAVKMAKDEDVTTDDKVNNGKIDVPSILLDPVAVTKENLDDTIIKDGFHKKEDVYK
ncbi:D-xylose ABC transporter substrate-binding protein [Priestia koreensis]|uniref:D-xylose ABC transporter substrate-binding protein n=1 Tax=Priestia koreensis TaxID=284581 RepID=UPI001F58C097|nr:D-xylose ABC transporter substrate-binding protein [Priestia koreensis]MCM3006455.1 D-xylose ABC transporter substrate-binding protein [Priestia koreensis]UNL83643.1 D-xylose ABC transporter substrate-binding protein [Priestia koreensis]